MKDEIIICECGNAEHQWIIRQFDDCDDCIFVHVHLQMPRSFWRRVVYAFRYLFGYRSRYGAFDEIILSRQHAEQFAQLSEHLKILSDY
jgi:hypothetical protein